jgi:cystathionine beta-lyase/cystathionine gamma-synthase
MQFAQKPTPYLGGKLSPFDAWLLIRGMRTLPTRMKAHEASALEIAKRLQALDTVETVCHPALANRLPAGLTGTSGLFSVIFHEGVNIREFCNHLNLFKLGVSWGGHESLIVPGEVVLQQKAQPNSAHTFALMRARCACMSDWKEPKRCGETLKERSLSQSHEINRREDKKRERK